MVDAIVSYVVQKLRDYLTEQAVFLEGVRDDVEWLRNELGWMQCFLKDAEEKQGDDERVRKWFSEIRDIACESEDVLDTFLLQVEEESTSKPKRNSFASIMMCSCTSKGFNLYDIGKHIQALRNRLLDISRKREIYGIKDIVVGREGKDSNIEKLRQLRRSARMQTKSTLWVLMMTLAYWWLNLLKMNHEDV